MECFVSDDSNEFLEPAPGAAPEARWKKEGSIGEGLDRIDGRLKVTGGARYAAEFSAPNMTHGVLVLSKITKGKVTSIDTAEALKLPGVIAVITADNMPDLKPVSGPMGGQPQPLLTNNVQYAGQTLGIVVAETLEAATEGAELVKFTYEAEKPEVVLAEHLDDAEPSPPKSRTAPYARGDFDAGLNGAQTKVDELYWTPWEHHNPMEPHATLAIWDGDKMTVYDATQGVTGSAQNIARKLHLPVEKVQVIDPFVGGGFGCKGMSWPHSPITAMAAMVVKRPVKLSLTRRQMFTSNGHRPTTRQQMVLGASADGRLVALEHHAHCDAGRTDTFIEPTGASPSMLYACSNVKVQQDVVRLDIPPATFMRAPGEASGSFGQEVAMDELAYALGIDPVELRLKNYAEQDPKENRPFTSKSLRQCYLKAAEGFGWSKRNPKPGSMKNGPLLVGYGMATAAYPANVRASSATARMNPDGTAVILCGTQDIGTGTYTILAQIASDVLGLPVGAVQVHIADSSLPKAPGSGGSCSAASAGSAVFEAARGLKQKLIELAQQQSLFAGLTESEVTAKNGKLSAPGGNIAYAELLSRAGGKPVENTANIQPPGQGPGQSGSAPRTGQGFGAQFCEVHIDPELKMIRVVRWVGAFALGTVLNAKTITSQLQGGIVFGIGMGLLEETLIDPNIGRYLNTNLAEYHVPVNKDVPNMEIMLIPEEDPYVNAIGVKGAGEIGITGAAAAIANAIHHATGKRVRDLPITLDKIL